MAKHSYSSHGSGTTAPRKRDDDVNAASRGTNKYMGPRKTRTGEAANHNTGDRDPYKWNPGQTHASEDPDHATAETDPYVYEGGGSDPRRLGGSRADGTHNPAGKIGGYVDQVVGQKNPAYSQVSGDPAQDWDIGQAHSMVEGAPSFAPYKDKPPATGPTDFSHEQGDIC